MLADYSIILELGKQQLAHRIHSEAWQPTGHEAVCLARQLALAMCHLHDKGILHRDLNPSNVLFGEHQPMKQWCCHVCCFVCLGAHELIAGHFATSYTEV